MTAADDIEFPACVTCPNCGLIVQIGSQRGARMELEACPNHFDEWGRAQR